MVQEYMVTVPLFLFSSGMHINMITTNNKHSEQKHSIQIDVRAQILPLNLRCCCSYLTNNLLCEYPTSGGMLAVQ